MGSDRCPTSSGPFRCDHSVAGHAGECTTRERAPAWVGPALRAPEARELATKALATLLDELRVLRAQSAGLRAKTNDATSSSSAANAPRMPHEGLSSSSPTSTLVKVSRSQEGT